MSMFKQRLKVKVVIAINVTLILELLFTAQFVRIFIVNLILEMFVIIVLNNFMRSNVNVSMKNNLVLFFY